MELKAQRLPGVAERSPRYISDDGLVLTGQVTRAATLISSDGTTREIPGGKPWCVYHGPGNQIKAALPDVDQSIAIAQTGNWLLYASKAEASWLIFCRNMATKEERAIQRSDGIAWLRDVTAEGVVFGSVLTETMDCHVPAIWEAGASEPEARLDAIGGGALGLSGDHLVCLLSATQTEPGGVALIRRSTGEVEAMRRDLTPYRYTTDGWLVGASHEENAPILTRATVADLERPIAEMALAGEGDAFDASGDYVVGMAYDGAPAIWSVQGKRRLFVADLEEISLRFRLHGLHRVVATSDGGFHAAGLSEPLQEGEWKLDPTPGSRIILVSR